MRLFKIKTSASSCWWKENADRQLSHFVWDADSCLYCTILSVTVHLFNGLSEFDIRGGGKYWVLLNQTYKLSNDHLLFLIEYVSHSKSKRRKYKQFIVNLLCKLITLEKTPILAYLKLMYFSMWDLLNNTYRCFYFEVIA